jgi:hypothetical protein
MQSIEDKIIRRIYGRGRGWAFSQRDFSELGRREAIDVSLHRLGKKGKIRRIIRGIYEYPKNSILLKKELSPDIDQVARALARKFGWNIQPSGPASLNMMGVSPQVPGRYIYLSSGPDRLYIIGKTVLQFQHAMLKEASIKLPESALIVQGLRSLGKSGITTEVIVGIRNWLDPTLRTKVLKDTKTVTDWIYKAIREICVEDRNG